MSLCWRIGVVGVFGVVMLDLRRSVHLLIVLQVMLVAVNRVARRIAYSSAVGVRRSIASASVWICLGRLAISGLGLAVRVPAVLLVVLRHGVCFAIELGFVFRMAEVRRQTRKLRKDALTERNADSQSADLH
jgi:hypothetical protein